MKIILSTSILILLLLAGSSSCISFGASGNGHSTALKGNPDGLALSGVIGDTIQMSAAMTRAGSTDIKVSATAEEDCITLAMQGTAQNMKAVLDMSASRYAAIDGQVTDGGLTCFSPADAAVIMTAPDIAVERAYAYEDGQAVKAFGITATKSLMSSDYAIEDSGGHPEIADSGGSPKTFILKNAKIKSPKTLYWIDNSVSKAEGVPVEELRQTLEDAAETWDYWAPQELFNNVLITTRKGKLYDGKSTHEFAPIGSERSTVLAVTTSVIRVGTIIEADSKYNSRKKWTTDFELASTDRTYIDIQTIMLHELGHFVGFKDVYVSSAPSYMRADKSAIMNSYSGPQHALGSGEIVGMQKKYGSVAA